MDREVAAESHLRRPQLGPCSGSNTQVEHLFECFEGAAKFAEEVARKHLKIAGREGCIPECFVGHYRVKHDPGLHFPVNSWDALTAAPFRCAPPRSAEKTWPRFFIAARISSRDSVCFRRFFWSDLEPIRESYRSDKSIQWVKVHRLADFVYFNHSIHISKGVGCSSSPPERPGFQYGLESPGQSGGSRR